MQRGAEIRTHGRDLKSDHSDRSTYTTSFSDPDDGRSPGGNVLIQHTKQSGRTVRKPERLIENCFSVKERRY